MFRLLLELKYSSRFFHLFLLLPAGIKPPFKGKPLCLFYASTAIKNIVIPYYNARIATLGEMQTNENGLTF